MCNACMACCLRAFCDGIELWALIPHSLRKVQLHTRKLKPEDAPYATEGTNVVPNHCAREWKFSYMLGNYSRCGPPHQKIVFNVESQYSYSSALIGAYNDALRPGISCALILTLLATQLLFLSIWTFNWEQWINKQFMGAPIMFWNTSTLLVYQHSSVAQNAECGCEGWLHPTHY